MAARCMALETALAKVGAVVSMVSWQELTPPTTKRKVKVSGMRYFGEDGALPWLGFAALPPDAPPLPFRSPRSAAPPAPLPPPPLEANCPALDAFLRGCLVSSHPSSVALDAEIALSADIRLWKSVTACALLLLGCAAEISGRAA